MKLKQELYDDLKALIVRVDSIKNKMLEINKFESGSAKIDKIIKDLFLFAKDLECEVELKKNGFVLDDITEDVAIL